jgi:hypothetical protein
MKKKKQKIYRNSKQFSILFLSENCFDKNYPNAFLVLFSVFKHFFNKKKKNNRKLFFFLVSVLKNNFQKQKQLQMDETIWTDYAFPSKIYTYLHLQQY